MVITVQRLQYFSHHPIYTRLADQTLMIRRRWDDKMKRTVEDVSFGVQWLGDVFKVQRVGGCFPIISYFRVFLCVGLSIGNTRPHLLLLSSSIDPFNLIIYYYYIALRGDYLMNETVNDLNVCCISIFKLCFIFIGVVFLSCFHSFFFYWHKFCVL